MTYINSLDHNPIYKLETESILIDDLKLIFDKIVIVNNPRQVKILTKETNPNSSNSSKITLTLIYYASTREKKNYIETQVKDSSNIHFRIYGFDEYNKICTQIAPLGTFNNRPLFFSYCAQRINQFAMEISIQLYLGGN